MNGPIPRSIKAPRRFAALAAFGCACALATYLASESLIERIVRRANEAVAYIAADNARHLRSLVVSNESREAELTALHKLLRDDNNLRFRGWIGCASR